jgi:ketosteroid isomerase-like protein/quercetin dioxygenase-like cupin family protein
MFVVALFAAGCAPSVNVEQERNTLLALDREWSQSSKDVEKYLSYFAPEASVYPPGMPVSAGTAAIRETYTKISSTPGFSVSWTPTKAEVSTSGDLGYTVGTYEFAVTGVSETGKYVTTVALAPSALKWGDSPPSMPPGAKVAVVSGDPTQAGSYVIRAQMPAGYRIPPHWHPADEHVTVLAGTVALGMGETFDQSAMKDVPSGGYFVAPAKMRHFFAARSAATIQGHGTGPFAITYVNAADDPRQK